MRKLEILGAATLALGVLAFDLGATYTANKAKAATSSPAADQMAVFMLYKPDGAAFGPVQNIDPLTNDQCQALINDPDARMWVAEQVKEQTGEDLIVRGFCHPVGGAPSRPA